MPSLRDRLGLNKPKAQVAPKPNVVAQNIPNKPKGKNPPPPYTAFITITCKCGHQEQFGMWDPKKDKFLAQRKVKHESRDCAECRQKKFQEQQELSRQKRFKGNAKQRKLARLPDGAEFHVVFDAEKVSWSGTLKVTSEEHGEIVLSAERGPLFTLLGTLDVQFRRLWEQKEEQARAKKEGVIPSQG